MDGWSLSTLVLFPVPSLCVISPRHHFPSLFRQKTRASVSITKNLLITKGYQWWLLARCSFCPVLIIHSAHEAGNMEDSVNGLLQKMLSDWWVSKPAIFYQISYQSIANSNLDWPHLQPYTPPGHVFLTSALPFSASWTPYPVPTLAGLPCPSHVLQYIRWPQFRRRRGYLFALTNEHSGAFTIDVV